MTDVSMMQIQHIQKTTARDHCATPFLVYHFSLGFIQSVYEKADASLERIEMKKRKLGHSDLEISPFVFGGNVFGWTVDEATAFTLLDAFVAAGFNAIDTADSYSQWVPGHVGGESETMIGKWLKRSGHRDKVIVMTKVGWDRGPGQKGLSRDYILRSAENSLRRLQTGCIDLYQSHVDDPETPQEETLRAYADLIQQGKVRFIGASNHKAGRLASALAVSANFGLPKYQSLQPNYNLYDREEFESELEPVCLREGLGVISYFPLGGGFLSGKYRSEADMTDKARARTVKKYMNERGMRILDALDEVAKRTGATPAKISLAWLLARPGITAPIVSVTNRKQLDDLISSVELNLDQSSIELLNRASAYAASTAS
jgi:aryl-alcohol dehydrogenase-like predicted oxidoreductase